MARHFYWPRTPEYAIPWVAGPTLYALLGAFGLPGGKLIDLGSVPNNLAAHFLVLVLLFALNTLFLWLHLRPQFLTWSTARGRFWGTLGILTLGNLVLSGAVLLLRGDATLSLDPAEIDWLFTLHCIDLGLLGLTVALLVSAVWKTEEPGVSNLRLERENTLMLVSRLQSGTINRDEFNDLRPTLAQLEDSARPLAARLSESDLALLAIWRKSSRELHDLLQGKDFSGLRQLRQDHQESVNSALRELSRTQ